METAEKYHRPEPGRANTLSKAPMACRLTLATILDILSRERYCSVWHSLRQDIDHRTTYEIRKDTAH